LSRKTLIQSAAHKNRDPIVVQLATSCSDQERFRGRTTEIQANRHAIRSARLRRSIQGRSTSKQDPPSWRRLSGDCRVWGWLKKRARERRAKNYLRLYPSDEPAVRSILNILASGRPESARGAAKMPMVENCLRPNGLPTLTDGSGFGMRSYCRNGSLVDDAPLIH
jgi:hypothetical protein